ncbi:MAG: glutamine-hydrolyzing carbamoyl-phosphate synthase small subunit [Limnochordia bacterium]
MRSILMLENGTIWEGESLGIPGEVHGEVVFNTSMTGYEDILMDPSSYGDILTLTYPLIGNYGINTAILDDRPFPRGLVVSEVSLTPSHWQSGAMLTDFLQKYGLVGISGIDTRALTRTLRDEGTMKGAIATGDVDPDGLLKRIIAAPDRSSQDLVSEVTARQPLVEAGGSGKRIVIIDLGAKRRLLSYLKAQGFHITVVPASTPAETVLALHPDAIMITSGPGNPKVYRYVIEAVARLIGSVPVFGIGLGHQVLALALGADAHRLKHGHRGSNHPVMDHERRRVLITSQNHGFVVDSRSLPGELIVTHTSLHDQTIEGLRHRYLNVSSVQYDPLTSPDSQLGSCVIDRFLNELRKSA